MALLLFSATFAGCSLLLDTDSLTSGGPSSSGTAETDGGGVSDASASSEAEASSSMDASEETPEMDAGQCTTDFDCFEQPNDDPCTVNACDPQSHRCKPAMPFQGAGLQAVDPMPVAVVQADDIGLPVLTADNQFIVLGYWKKNGNASDVIVRRYDATNATAASVEVNLGSLSTGYSSWASSPGLLLTRRSLVVRGAELLVAAQGGDAAAPGVHLLDLEFTTGGINLAATQPTTTDLSSTYTADVHTLAPLLTTFPGPQPSGLWVSDGQLFGYDNDPATAGLLFDGSSATPPQHIEALGPIEATKGLHAALEVSDGTSMYSLLWNSDSGGTADLNGDQTLVPHFGIATTSIDEGVYAFVPATLVLWSQGATLASSEILAAGAACVGASCGASSLGDSQPTPTAGIFPALGSNRADGDASRRYIGEAFLTLGPAATVATSPGATSPDAGAGSSDAGDAARVQATLVAGIAITTVAGGDPPLKAVATNPAAVQVASAVAPSAARTAERIGQVAVATTPGGQMLVAWVERTERAVLYVRRYATVTCN